MKKITVYLKSGASVEYTAEEVETNYSAMITIGNRVHVSINTWTEGRLWWKRQRSSDITRLEPVAYFNRQRVAWIDIEDIP